MIKWAPGSWRAQSTLERLLEGPNGKVSHGFGQKICNC